MGLLNIPTSYYMQINNINPSTPIVNTSINNCLFNAETIELHNEMFHK